MEPLIAKNQILMFAIYVSTSPFPLIREHAENIIAETLPQVLIISCG